MTIEPGGRKRLHATRGSFRAQQPQDVLNPHSVCCGEEDMTLRPVEREMQADGNCMFRAVSDQMYHTPEYHPLIRQKVSDYIRVERHFFAPFIDGGESFEDYCTRKAKDGVWGNDIELQAISEIYDSGIEIYTPDGHLLRTFHELGPSEQVVTQQRGMGPAPGPETSSSSSHYLVQRGEESSNPSLLGQQPPGGRTTLRLVYRGQSHYNSLRPSNPDNFSSNGNRASSYPLILRVRERYLYYCGRGLMGNLNVNPTGQTERPPCSLPGEIEDMAIERRKRCLGPSSYTSTTSRGNHVTNSSSSSNAALAKESSDEQVGIALEHSREEFQQSQRAQEEAAVAKSLEEAGEAEEIELQKALAMSVQDSCTGQQGSSSSLSQVNMVNNDPNHFPDCVLACVSMGFSLEEARKAYEFVGDNEDELIMFLTMSRDT